MATFIRYTNEMQDEISLAQTVILGRFIKQYFIDDLLSKEEYIVNGELSQTVYYISSLSDSIEILQEDPNASFHYSFEQSDYIMNLDLSYVNGNLNEKTYYLKDMSGNTICYLKYNLPADIPNYSSMEKSYYDNEGELKYTFIYLANGVCCMIYDEQEDQADIHPGNIGQPNEPFSWSGFEYYQFAEPLMPAS